MPKIGKIAFPLLIIGITGLAVWGFIFLKNESKNSSGNAPGIQKITIEENQTDQSGAPNNADSTNSPLPVEIGPNSLENPTPQSLGNPAAKPSEKALAHITPQHCDDGCQAFRIDLKLFEYCEQACGISPVAKVSSCDGKKGIERDYCLKDLAIGSQDDAACDNIKDDNIKNACATIIEENAFRAIQEKTGTQRENPPY